VEAAYTVIAGEFVSLSDGTGVVHIAPAFGGEDFDLGRELGLLFLQPVSRTGAIKGTLAKGVRGGGASWWIDGHGYTPPIAPTATPPKPSPR